METHIESLTTERLVIIVDVASRPGMGKTSALASITRELRELVGPSAKFVIYEPSPYPLHKKSVGLVEFNRNDVRIGVEVFHRG